MLTFLLPAARSGIAPPSPAAIKPKLHRPLSLSPSTQQPLPFPPFSPSSLHIYRNPLKHPNIAAAPISSAYTSPNDDSEKAKLAQVAKRLESTSRYFKRLGSLGFWGQLVCTIVAAVILSFSVVITGRITSPATFYATAGGICAAFLSVFWSFGYIRLSDRLQKTANDPSKVTHSKRTRSGNWEYIYNGQPTTSCPSDTGLEKLKLDSLSFELTFALKLEAFNLVELKLLNEVAVC